MKVDYVPIRSKILKLLEFTEFVLCPPVQLRLLASAYSTKARRRGFASSILSKIVLQCLHTYYYRYMHESINDKFLDNISEVLSI